MLNLSRYLQIISLEQSITIYFMYFMPGEDLVAVGDVSFRAFGDQIMALLGHNGAGKSTTFNVLAGNVTPNNIFYIYGFAASCNLYELQY